MKGEKEKTKRKKKRERKGEKTQKKEGRKEERERRRSAYGEGGAREDVAYLSKRVGRRRLSAAARMCLRISARLAAWCRA